MKSIKLYVLLFTATIFLIKTEACLLSRKHRQYDFMVRWRVINKTLYGGNSVKELLAMCPNGCDASNCSTFPVHKSRDPKTGKMSSPIPEPCNDYDIQALRQAQEIARGWKDAIKIASIELIIHSVLVIIIILLNVVLIFRRHYRIRNLWFLPSDRQWELERDPTWGLPGKVWGLLQMRVVKTENLEPTDRKYESYTDNPTIQGEDFWYYKQVLRDMYKKHKYYKRNRYFHKLSWQFNSLRKVIPETLRRQRTTRRRAGELEEQRSNASSAEVDPQENLPWEIELPAEINILALKKAKDELQEYVREAEITGRMINGRLINSQHQHHHNVQVSEAVPVLTPQEVQTAARQMEFNPTADFVNVDGNMMLHPAAANKPGARFFRHHHQHQHHHTSKQPKSHPESKAGPVEKSKTK